MEEFFFCNPNIGYNFTYKFISKNIRISTSYSKINKHSNWAKSYQPTYYWSNIRSVKPKLRIHLKKLKKGSNRLWQINNRPKLHRPRWNNLFLSILYVHVAYLKAMVLAWNNRLTSQV